MAPVLKTMNEEMTGKAFIKFVDASTANSGASQTLSEIKVPRVFSQESIMPPPPFP